MNNRSASLINSLVVYKLAFGVFAKTERRLPMELLLKALVDRADILIRFQVESSL